MTVERTSGLAGMRRTASLDTATLGPEGADVERLVEEARFFSLPPRAPGAPGADRFRFRITVEAGRRQHTIEVGEQDLEGPLGALVRRVHRA